MILTSLLALTIFSLHNFLPQVNAEITNINRLSQMDLKLADIRQKEENKVNDLLAKLAIKSLPSSTPRPSLSPSPSNKTTSQSLFLALNNYRVKQGLNALIWNQTLGNYAQSRSDYYLRRGSMDNHEGFKQLTSTAAGFHQLGFRSLGENSSSGYNTTPVALIEKIYASSPRHQENQLNPNWTHAGIGVSGLFTDLVFGGNKI